MGGKKPHVSAKDEKFNVITFKDSHNGVLVNGSLTCPCFGGQRNDFNIGPERLRQFDPSRVGAV
jgi:hypothetical protein